MCDALIDKPFIFSVDFIKDQGDNIGNSGLSTFFFWGSFLADFATALLLLGENP